MHIVRYARRDDGAIGVGLRSDGGEVRPLQGLHRMADLLALPLDEIRARVDAHTEPALASDEVVLLPPLDGRTELRGAGVTYERSREARVEESAERSVYERVYEARRPELFFKSVAWRVVTTDEPVGLRPDCAQCVPEPELGVVVAVTGEIAGYVVCNDMTSRAIEGENPVYLPQAKLFAGSTSVSPGIRPAWEVPDPAQLAIQMTVWRDGAVVWTGVVSTASMRRPPEELVAHLLTGDRFPEGVVLSTGTGLVPGLDFALHAHDRVDVKITSIGRISNPVVVGIDAFRWLDQAMADPRTREAAR